MENTPAVPTPAPSGGTDLTEKLRQLDPIFKSLAGTHQKMLAGQAGAPTAMIPALVGQAPSSLAAGPPLGAAGQMLPGMPTVPQMGQVRPAVSPAPQAGVYQSGFDYSTKRGARGATVASAIQGISGFVNKIRQQKEEKQSKEAQNLMSILIEASKNPDTEPNKKLIGLILGNEKNVKILDKTFGEAFKVMRESQKQQKTSPEYKGFISALQEAKSKEGKGQAQPTAPPQGLTLPSPSAEAQVTASGQETELLRQQVMRQGMGQALEQGRGAEAIGLGPLTHGEQRGLIFSEAARATAGMEQKKAEFIMGMASDIFKMEEENKVKLQLSKDAGERARLILGPAYKRNELALKILESKGDEGTEEDNKRLTESSAQLRTKASVTRSVAERMYDKNSEEYGSLMREAKLADSQADESDAKRKFQEDIRRQKMMNFVMGGEVNAPE